jgi:hypothetical protein
MSSSLNRVPKRSHDDADKPTNPPEKKRIKGDFFTTKLYRLACNGQQHTVDYHKMKVAAQLSRYDKKRKEGLLFALMQSVAFLTLRYIDEAEPVFDEANMFTYEEDENSKFAEVMKEAKVRIEAWKDAVSALNTRKSQLINTFTVIL